MTATEATNGLAAASGQERDSTARLFAKISWRLLPFLMLCYVVAFLDRINIGFAKLQMKQTLPFSDATYGIGAGIFFIGYMLFEVPSNLLLDRIGVRKTMLRIMFAWGIVSAAMALVQTPAQFYVARVLLGVFEAGFLPGVLLYLTYWYPPMRRGQVLATFMSATAIAPLLAGPICGATLKYLDGFGGLHGWQWLFISQGVPASLLGIAAYFYLQDKPKDVSWLTAGEKSALLVQLEQDPPAVETSSHSGFWQMASDPKIYALVLVDILLIGSNYTMVFSIPSMIKSWGISDLFHVGLLSTLPQIAGLIGMIVVGRHSDKHRERRWHYASCVAVAALGMLVMTFAQGNIVLAVLGLTIAGAGFISAVPLFVTICTEYLSKASMAGGIAFIAGLANLGPAVAPPVTGFITATTGNHIYSNLLVVALYLLSGTLLLITLRNSSSRGR
ncbi:MULTISPECIES: MFS transporter [Rhodopseudomonas]|uniref:Major facilitator transporter n=1 Tax=Rhodopseudomonas palustris TaxID=1076 RepID=A0A0D7EKL6_RHOPL|nr:MULTISPECIES: MFS transporter [Rhodopseudomonas]KIZ41338.1 major facilitator transporter [Rhodopseudomonas palustris]MDF3810968.1 MFS transporter [Rhodopseudomonas sp. BAL398]WOK16912.1 MFS transporter [Rhodopseudomonas sp. BAL398]